MLAAAAIGALVGAQASGKAQDDKDEMVLLNLMYAPRRSRLHSLLRTLTRIENAGQICAWTKASNLTEINGTYPLVGCPPIDLVDIPRLKLAFCARPDHAGQLRLYSVDHADHFVCNDRNPLTTKCLSDSPILCCSLLCRARCRCCYQLSNLFVLKSKASLSQHCLCLTEIIQNGMKHCLSGFIFTQCMSLYLF